MFLYVIASAFQRVRLNLFVLVTCTQLYEVIMAIVFVFPVHMWRYRGGYPALTEVMSKLRQNKVKDIKYITVCLVLLILVLLLPTF